MESLLSDAMDLDSNVTSESAILPSINVTLNEVTKYFNISVANLTNETQSKLFDLYEAYRTKEKEQLMAYKMVAYILGTLIILSNITVVISSGLILKKGQQPKSTYLLLGNVSLADTIIGISIIFGALVDNSINSNPLCVFQIGMLVCPAMVSIFSVGLIAIDRYIYILHGLYYQRWFNTTKVRIGIVCIWIIGITLGFLPASGWVNNQFNFSQRCTYGALFPKTLILINSILSLLPIIVVAVLYFIILGQALRSITTDTTIQSKNSNVPTLRIYKGNATNKTNGTNSIKHPAYHNNNKLGRSASLHAICDNHIKPTMAQSKSASNLRNDLIKSMNRLDESHYNSKFSINTEVSTISSVNLSNANIELGKPNLMSKCKARIRSTEHNKKWRAITVVMLTSGSFVITWTPFFITVILYIFCENKLTNPNCVRMKMMLAGPLATLAFFNSILNPLIYAWWHKGFKRSIKATFKKYIKSRVFNQKSPLNKRIKQKNLIKN